MLQILLSMTLFALVGAITPGPVNVMATNAGANYGLKGAVNHVLGASLSYAFIVLLAGLGVGQLIIELPMVAMVLQTAGVIFLLYMAYKIANVKSLSDSQGIEGQYPSFWRGWFAQMLNPKAWLVSISGVSLFVSQQQNTGFYVVAFTIISLVICIIGVGCWAILGNSINRYLSKRNPSNHYSNNAVNASSDQNKLLVRFNRLMACLLVLSVIIILFDYL